VHTRDDLADLATDELTEITGQSADEATALIMKAREHWFSAGLSRVMVMKGNQQMSSTTVAEFATELKKSTDTLLEQLRSAGVPKASASDPLTEADKQKLLATSGQPWHGLGRAQEDHLGEEIDQRDQAGRCQGKARTIQVEVRKKRTFIKRDDARKACR
jgi:transcription termination factor NusA